MDTFDINAPEETWHPIPSLPGYELSNRFRVRSFRVRGRTPDGDYSGIGTRSRFLAVKQGPIGYLIFNVRRSKGERPTPIYLHHVVAEITLGPRLPGALVRHLNDDKLDNRPENLSYGTRADNSADAARNGRTARGERNGVAKLDIAAVREIRGRLARGDTLRAIARDFGVTSATVYGIGSGRLWRHVISAESE